LESEDVQRLIKKSRKLCEDLLPNLIVYDPHLTLGVPNTAYLSISIILEARRNIGVVQLWPEELDLLVYGCRVGPIGGAEDPRTMIFTVLDALQQSIYGEIKSKR
jgi:hypothetical protein